MPAALDAVSAADIITIGPGSLFTSILPPLLVNGLAEAIAQSRAVRVFVSNLMTQPGETEGLSLGRHIEVIAEYAPQITFDHILINDRAITTSQREKYGIEGSEQIGIHGSVEFTDKKGANLIYANLLDESEKVRHHPLRLAEAILGCVSKPARGVVPNG
jgi:uncharacterized cofD-like protein